MTHYLMSVHGPAERDEFGNYGSKEQMEEAFAATGAFNDKLQADGYWVFAGGLAPASTATVVDGRGETPVMSDGCAWTPSSHRVRWRRANHALSVPHRPSVFTCPVLPRNITQVDARSNPEIYRVSFDAQTLILRL